MNKNWRRRIRHIAVQHGVPILVLLSLVMAYHAPFLLRGSTYYSDDIIHQHFPSFVYASRRLRAGEFPLWNPHQFSGFPYLADSVAQLLYPPLWFLLVLGSEHIMTYIILHYLLAGLTFYFAAPSLGINSRHFRLIASVVFTLSGFMLLQTSNLVNLCAYVWIPLAALAATNVVKRPSISAGVRLGGVLALQVLSGGVQIALGTLYLMMFYILARLVSSRLDGQESWASLPIVTGKSVLGGIIGVSIAAAQIIASWEFTRLSVRAPGSSYDWASSYSLAPSRLLSLFIGAIHAKPASWAEAAELGDGRLGYAGICVIALVMLSPLVLSRDRKVQFFVVAALGFLALSMGRYTPLHRFAYHILPGFQVLRTPVRYLSLYIFCVSVVVGSVLSQLTVPGKGGTLALAFVSVGLLTGVVGTVVALKPDDFWRLAGLPVLFLGLLATFSLACYGGFVPKRTLNLVIICLIATDLLIFGWQQHLPVAPRGVFDLEPLRPIGEWLQAQETSDYYRVYWPNDLRVKEDEIEYEARAPLAVIWNIHGVEGYSQLKPQLYERIWQELPLTRVLELLNTRYVLAGAVEDPAPPDSVVFEESGISVHKTDKYLPRAFVASESRAVQLEEAFSILSEPSFDAAKVVLLDSYSSPSLPEVWPERAEGSAEITDYRPELIEVSAHLPHTGVLVLNEPYYPGWKCEVDGQRVDIHRANAILRAVILPPGSHTVTFRYSPTLIRTGAFVSVIALLLSLLFCSGETML